MGLAASRDLHLLGERAYSVHLRIRFAWPGLSGSTGGSIRPAFWRCSTVNGLGIQHLEEACRPDDSVRTCHAPYAKPYTPLFDSGRTLCADWYVGIYSRDASASLSKHH